MILSWIHDIPIPPGTPTRGETEKLVSNYPADKLVRADVGMMQEMIPDVAAEALIQTSKEQSKNVPGYKDSRGIELLRKTIAEYYDLKYGVMIDPNWIVIGLGASECFMATSLALFDKGNLILTSAPFYPNHTASLYAKGADWLAISTTPDTNFHPNYQEMEKSAAKSKSIRALYQSNPNNPSGAVLTLSEIEQTFWLLDKYGLIGLFDDVYSVHKFTDDSRPDSFLHGFSLLGKDKLNRALKSSIIFDSMSKKFGLADWRVGWAIVANNEVRKRIMPYISYRGSTPGTEQLAAEKVIRKLSENNFALEKQINKLYRKKSRMVYDGLKRMDGLGVKVSEKHPEGSIYIMAELPMKSFDLLKYSLSRPESGKQVTTFVPMTTPDGSFYSNPKDGENLFRFCFGLPKEKINLALDCLKNQIKYFS